MYNELKLPLENKKIFCFHTCESFQRNSKKAFAIGVLLSMNATFMTALASPDNSWQEGDRIGVSSNSQSTTYLSPPDVYTLQEQLLEKTRELHDYKAKLFRASHPNDHAKITELNQKIAEHEKHTIALNSKIKEFEEALSNAKKQLSTLDISTQALTDYIQKQRITAESEKQELIARLQAHEDDPRLENEQKLNEKLNADLKALTNKIATYEKQLNNIEQNHESELQDALQDSAILKFELADLRLMAEIKESELIFSSLDYQSIALHHADTLDALIPEHQSTIAHLSSQIRELHDSLAKEEATNARQIRELQNQIALDGETKANQIQDLQESLVKQIEAKTLQIQELQDKLAIEEKINANKIHELHKQIVEQETAKQDLIHEKEWAFSNHEVEKHAQELALQEKEAQLKDHQLNTARETDSLHKKLQDYQMTIDNMKVEIERLNAHEDALSAKQKELEDTINTLSLIAEQQDNALAEANSSFSMIQEYNYHLEAENEELNKRLDKLELADRTSKKETANNPQDNQSIVSPALLMLLKSNSNYWNE